jgi:hypothetical protein
LSTTVSTTETNLALAREYTDRVFNAHQPELAAGYFTANVKWHGGTLGTIEGPDNVVALLQGFIGGLPDLNAVEEEAGAAPPAANSYPRRRPSERARLTASSRLWTPSLLYRRAARSLAADREMPSLSAMMEKGSGRGR